MLLRPAKLFSPLHQLGKYLEGKVTELVQQQPPPHSSFQIARKRFYHASPNTQLISKAHYHSKTVPTLYHVAEREQQRLLRVLQKQFPIVKVFSSPTIVRPTGYQLSFAKNISQSHMQQFRTIVSSGASSTSTSSAAAVEGGFAGFAGAGGGGFFPRAPMVGYARTPFAARQFSTARSPCVTMFQQSTANTNGISHVSRFFSPAGSKMWVPNVNDSHARPSPSPSLHQDEDGNGKSSGANTVPLCNNNNNRKQQHDDLKQQQQTQQSSGRRSTTRKDRKRRRNTNAARRYRYDYIHHDDLSCRYMPGSEKKVVPSSIRHHWQTSQLKAPPDSAVVYLSIKLDGASFWEQHFSDEDESQLLDAAFIGSLHSVSELYQMFLGQVVVLLNTLQKCGTFELVVSDDRELRVIFPSSQYWPAEDRKSIACRWLAEIGIDPTSTCFTIEEMEPPTPSTSTFTGSHDTTPSTSQQQQDSDVLGPDYFKGIQAFLDHVDEMIESGPAFGRR
ncbi:hypothetical protein O0I10_006852 [Lichtheimia ornata]|uniref:Uncharacterized protein n=1 Tax=Lichtheimia ornata TaxID=688661 RepID=A0AAD7V2D0_9FUNG|nr:uncharacterized protein O0I10_006852 [Lichtheimia ornata]KAJ8657550.1 hypothetical protein O0I10_006852 [Lichtheimia ornata]